jgi:uncharacterized membrane protein YczE
MTARAVRLVAGCVLLGSGVALMIRARLGLDPWTVFHQGVARHIGLPIGTVSILVGVVVLAAWVPLRQRPGVGTVVNVVLVGLTIDVALARTSDPTNLAIRAACLIAGIVVFAAGTGLYVGAGLGPGPRDGLMTGLSARHNRKVGGVRSAIEVAVLAAGWLLGGQPGVGTVVFALAIGPLVQLFLGRFSRERVKTPTPTLTPPSE